MKAQEGAFEPAEGASELIDSSPESTRAGSGLRPLYFYLIVILVFLADQASKWLIQKNMVFNEYRPLLGSNFMLTLTQNTGGAWGFLPHGNNVFVVFAALAIVALLIAYHRIARGDLLVASAFALALGGAIGNLLDRLRYGYVVDFFDVRIIHWPIFNIADSAISLGIVLLLLHYVKSMRAEAAARNASSVTV
jgi:signal peptidase II